MLKIGEYFRTPWGDIGKITNIPKHNKYFDDGFCLEGKFITCGSKAMKELNSTPNIIDLIEVGDYVNGHRIIDIAKDQIRALYYEDINQKYALIPMINKDIKSIVTKESMESVTYYVK